MRTRAVLAAALLPALGLLAGCGGGRAVAPLQALPTGPPTSAGPSVTVLEPARTEPPAGAAWVGWRPRFRDVRPPDPSVLADLGNRVTARNSSQWTATDELRGVEIAFTPRHVRAGVPRADLYLRLRPGGPLHAYVVCIRGACVEGGRDAVTWGPETSSAYLMQMATYVHDLLAEQTRTMELTDRGPTRLATLRSPGGRLTCVLHAADLATLDRLEGRPLPEDGVVARCVDAHGLVVPIDLDLPPGGWSDVVDDVSGPVRIKPSEVGVTLP